MPGSLPTADEPGTAVLACGVPFAAVVDQVDAGRLEPADAHQATCPHCRQALRTTATAVQSLELLRAAAGPVPAGLVDQVVRRVRQTRRDTAVLHLPAAEPPAGLPSVVGDVRVRLQVVADIARTAATALPGVFVARAGARPGPAAPDTVEVTLGLLVDGRTSLPEVARQVRRAVRVAARRALGPTPVRIELTVLDLLDRD